MKRIGTLLIAVALALGGLQAEAKRLGGGKSVGKQSSNVTQREATPNAPAAPAQSAAPAKPGTPAAAPAAAQPKKPWGAMLGGLAAGLAHSLGMCEAFGNMLMAGLLAVVVMMVVGYFLRRRAAAAQPGADARSPYAFEGAGAAGQSAQIPMPSQYKPENVGNDASARPFERSAASPLADANRGGSMIGSAIGGSRPASGWDIPVGFDSEGFLNAAKGNFITLQAAWDKADIGNLRSMMTDDMLKEIRSQLADRASHTGAGANHTEVLKLDAKLLGIEDLGGDYLASVEFSGMIQEDPAQGPAPFREVWNMTKPKDGSMGWLVAGVQALA
jgi:predicted lipid-binding transport protein (Tim44 family)